MSPNEKFALLCQQGDPIERRICFDEEALCSVIYTYASIWADFVYPRRIGDGSAVALEWMPFAGSHYTAIVRLHHAYRAKQQLAGLSQQLAAGKHDVDRLIDAHAATASFWENLGSCIDNLALAHEDAGLIERLGVDEDEKVEGSGGRKLLKMKYATIGEAYDRRTQFIHSRLVPQKIQDGALVFNVRLLQTKETYWPAKHGVEDEFVDDFHDAFWLKFMRELGDAWGSFYSWLRNKYGEPIETSPIQLPAVDRSLVKPSDILITDGPAQLSATVVPFDFDVQLPPSGWQRG